MTTSNYPPTHLKILNADQIRAIELATFEQTGVTSLAIMESAGREISRFLLEHYLCENPSECLFLLGSGNNGGDGYIAARTLINMGLHVRVLSTKRLEDLTGDARTSANAFLNCGGHFIVLQEDSSLESVVSEAVSRATVIVDCLLGTGVKGAPTGMVSEVIKHLNQSARYYSKPIVSVDLPSGLDPSTSQIAGICVKADVTLGIQNLKVCHVLFPSSESCGQVFLLDIGLTKNFVDQSSCVAELLCFDCASREAAPFLRLSNDAHKGTRGHVLVVGGSSGKFGAAKLSASAALLAGAGLATVILDVDSARVLGPVLNEVMCESFEEDESGFLKALGTSIQTKDAVVLGPGLGISARSRELVELTLRLCQELGNPVVVDADALNILAANPEISKVMPANAVVTPHPGEMSRLLGQSIQDVQADRLEAAKMLAGRWGAWVLLKGARSVIAAPDGRCFVNPTATESLATAGSGDVLSGAIGALLAKGLEPGLALRTAVFAHGFAGGQLCIDRGGSSAVIAGDIAFYLGLALNKLGAHDSSRSKPASFICKVFEGLS